MWVIYIYKYIYIYVGVYVLVYIVYTYTCRGVTRALMHTTSLLSNLELALRYAELLVYLFGSPCIFALSPFCAVEQLSSKLEIYLHSVSQPCRDAHTPGCSS